MTEPGAAAAQIVRCKLVNSSAHGSGFHHMPDRFRRDPRAPKSAHSVYAPKNRSGADFGGRGPVVNGSLHPNRDRNGADMLSLPDQIRDHPVVLPDLEILRPEGDQLGAPQATSNQDCENRP